MLVTILLITALLIIWVTPSGPACFGCTSYMTSEYYLQDPDYPGVTRAVKCHACGVMWDANKKTEIK